MADNGRWFKLWCSCIGDPDLDNLDIADFGRWTKLGAYIKEHGTEGEITLSEPSKMVCSMLQLNTLNDVFLCFQKMKNVTVSTVTSESVSIFIKYENWFKYQGDYSYDRVKKFRAKNTKNETPKKRREEKRREEKTLYPFFGQFWAAYPKKKSKGDAERTFAKINPDEQLLQKMLKKIAQAKTSDEWKKEGGKYIPYPATWLNAQGWEDEFLEEPVLSDDTRKKLSEELKQWYGLKDRREKSLEFDPENIEKQKAVAEAQKKIEKLEKQLQGGS